MRENSSFYDVFPNERRLEGCPIGKSRGVTAAPFGSEKVRCALSPDEDGVLGAVKKG